MILKRKRREGIVISDKTVNSLSQAKTKQNKGSHSLQFKDREINFIEECLNEYIVSHNPEVYKPVANRKDNAMIFEGVACLQTITMEEKMKKDEQRRIESSGTVNKKSKITENKATKRDIAQKRQKTITSMFMHKN